MLLISKEEGYLEEGREVSMETKLNLTTSRLTISRLHPSSTHIAQRNLRRPL